MINFIIVEDNKFQRERVKNIVISNMMSNKIDFKITEFSDYCKDLLERMKDNHENSVFILDLELPNGYGIDIAKKIRYKYNNWVSPIIIITAHLCMYYEAHKQRLQLLDFIGKIENIEKQLSKNIEICVKMLNKDLVYRFTYKNIDYAIKLSLINYIHREGRRTKIVTTKKGYYQNISISEIKKMMPDNFKTSSKGIIINMKNVLKIDWNDYKAYFKDGTSAFIVSRSHKKELDNYEFN